MREWGFFAVATLVAGCNVERGGLSNAPPDTGVALEDTALPDVGEDAASDAFEVEPLDARGLEVAVDAPDSAITCGEAGLICDDKDPCTSNACTEEETCEYAPYQDADGDGFQPSGAAPGCPKPFDCDDANPDAFPGQSKYFSFASDGAEFDYNCDGTAERRWNALATCTKIMGGCSVVEGWGGGVPACGVTGKWVTACHVESGSCVASDAACKSCRRGA
jgi:hypothetical protein